MTRHTVDVRITYMNTAIERRTCIAPQVIVMIAKLGKSPRSDEFARAVNLAARDHASSVAGRKTAGMYSWKVIA